MSSLAVVTAQENVQTLQEKGFNKMDPVSVSAVEQAGAGNSKMACQAVAHISTDADADAVLDWLLESDWLDGELDPDIAMDDASLDLNYPVDPAAASDTAPGAKSSLLKT